jgi:hypothetical protein
MVPVGETVVICTLAADASIGIAAAHITAAPIRKDFMRFGIGSSYHRSYHRGVEIHLPFYGDRINIAALLQ